MSRAQSDVTFRKQPDGITRAELTLGAQCVSWLELVRFTMRVGAADVEVDGIANVNTVEEHRMKGYSRRVMEATIQHMARGDAALSTLYGIGNLYHKFGYATAGPDYYLFIGLAGNDALPRGWTVRPFTVADLQAVRGLYDRCTRRSSGPAVRPDGHKRWLQIVKSEDALPGNACRVIVGPDGEVHAYAWLAHWHWTVVECLGGDYPDCFAVAEAVADSPMAADALLAGCRQWGREADDDRVKRILLPVPPGTHVATAAMYQNAECVQAFEANGGSMVRVLDVKRLLAALAPEMWTRLQDARSSFTGTLTIRTDTGDATVLIGPDEVSVVDEPNKSDGLFIEMPQTALGRLALGAFPPSDLIARFCAARDEMAADLVEAVFPLRHPHMYAPDRF